LAADDCAAGAFGVATLPPLCCASAEHENAKAQPKTGEKIFMRADISSP
jgi:hypothetical protein